ncbi:inter-alpha-trypsin inhibitor heavy chain H3 isoform X2 [Parambassis ranga]|uniref:Inter-alpha-trypsin inhibitor heavy chain H3 isoform X2 n=1 Tax=Parambassis ranga TaxID=210632 RepID=A0A6P7IIA4_9TELE|nr:inter-alpha-trypsin inhibitor heavy chain H3-like isoform X2 [Parambassis ranga]
MGRLVVQITLFGLLLALATTLPNKDDWDIYSFHINSTVTSRYATTVITSRVANRINESKEIEFHVQIPKNAFISRFRMFIDGQVYDGVVKAKEQAQQQYDRAVSRGESAGIVSSVGRTMEEFKTSVNVAGHKKITFELTYEELMKRTHGKYELQIHARPMQPVKDFKVDVYIHEKAGIRFIDVKGGLSTKDLANAITKIHADNQAWINFYPTVDQQKTCNRCGEQGMNGDLVIVYDVNRDSSLGDIKESDGYFVHHFAPSNLQRIPKNVVFVIDQSGSMSGRKIEQTRAALLHILNDLAEEDYFGLISFDSQLFHWKRELVQANSQNLDSAKTFVERIQDRGATDINRAVLEGARMLNANPREGSASILILLTDGDPTTGVTNREEIQSNVRRAIAEKFPLYCLGFGFDVNFEFLEKMSLQNNGAARRIYEDSDADLQLTGFYEEVATPLLTDVTMIYAGGTNLTQTNFSQYYNGSEIVVAGQITNNDIETFSPEVVAISRSTRVTFNNTNGSVMSTATESDGLIQRVWAYLTVKQLLGKELRLSGPEKDKAKKEALELSLKYNFVTPLTSMVVTKPEGDNPDVLHKPKEGRKAAERGFAGHAGSQSRLRGFGGGGTPSQRYGYARSPLFPGPPGPPGPPRSSGYSGLEHFLDQHLLFHDRDQQRTHGGKRFGLLRPAAAPVVHRFLLKTENQSKPLCFDFTGAALLKLFHLPSREMYVNGELESRKNGGFKKIFMHFQNDHHVEVYPHKVTVRVGQTVTHHTGQDFITAGSVTMIKRDAEVYVTAGDVHILVLVHQKGGRHFLWPVLRQEPSVGDPDGILALNDADYEEVQQTPITKLKMKDQEIVVSSDTADDYSSVPPVTVRCWFMSADSALQRPPSDFFVSQL